MTELLINRRNIRQIKFVTASESFDLMPNQLLLKIDHFAFTANNITYAAMGERIGYWQFFPANEEGWGKLPVWGFADVRATWRNRHRADLFGDAKRTGVA